MKVSSLGSCACLPDHGHLLICLMNDQGAPGCDLELCIVVQHVDPSILKGFLQRILRQQGIYVVHSQGCGAEEANTFVHGHFQISARGLLFL